MVPRLPPFRAPLPVARRWLILSWLALAWERLVLAFWPAASLVLGGLALGLSGLTLALPAWIQVGVLVLLGLALGLALRLGLRRFSVPRAADAGRRLEQGGALGRHRVLTAAADRLALGRDDPLSRALWRQHRLQARAAARTLRPRPPDPLLAERDPRAVRAVPVLALVVAIAASGGEGPARLLAFLTPRLGAPGDALVARVWLTPPEYTGLPPLSLDSARPAPTDDPSAPVRVPQGTTVLALLHGAADTARLEAGGQETALSPLDPRTLRGTLVIGEGGQLSVKANGHRILDRVLVVDPDHPPGVVFTRPPAPEGRGRLAFSVSVSDDHGVVAAGVSLQPVVPRHSDPRAPFTVDLPLPGPAPRAATVRAQPDLTAHRWAGREVQATPWAEDALGQRTTGPAETVTLPRRAFSHPVARALIAERDRLTEDPGTLPRVVASLDALSTRPEAFDNLTVIFLAVRAARAHLANWGRDADIERVRALLWEAAVRLEDGDSARLNADLDSVRDRLREAQGESLSQEDVDQLVRDMQAVLARTLDTLARTLAEIDPDGSLRRALGASQDATDLGRMLEELRTLNRLGAREAVRDLLARLDRMMEGLSGTPPSAEALQALRDKAAEARALEALRRDQEAVLDDTFRHAQASGGPVPPPGTQTLDTLPGLGLPDSFGGWPPETLTVPPWRPSDPEPNEEPRAERPSSPPAPSSEHGSRGGQHRGNAPQSAQEPPKAPQATRATLTGRQEELARRAEGLLGTLAEQSGVLPRSLGEAALAMDDAAGALKADALDEAMHAQRKALDRLTQDHAAALAALSRMLGPALPTGMGAGLPGPIPRGGQGSGLGPGQDVNVPDASATQRAREILDELHRRANDPARPAPDKAYIERLIPRF
ncbi:DUF4175 domain-containing protein [Pararhodospirillum oryzae]|uniref:TIGR02302 family protein n=1 Tax=Pararhodospirillum oryzae TaxID=478448 RepID=A0A512H4A9_9PROT|nr:DUF4175 family protein [Pararhodospirillum oryzae]GEO80248.1 hypothetical protein ROR02_03790 [Pararhodospirillum oryzae]